MLASVRALLANVIDYAGLFPPANLPMDEAIRNYARYRQEPESWILGKFICPATMLGSLASYQDTLFSAGPPFAFSILGKGGKTNEEFLENLDADLQAVAEFQKRHGNRVQIDSFEVKLPILDLRGALDGETYILPLEGRELLESAAGKFENRNLAGVRVYFESDLEPAWSTRIRSIIGTLAYLRILERWPSAEPPGFKLRCGGLQATAFPTTEQVATVVDTCRRQYVPFKATAGLHHPIRRYVASVKTKMHGFLNLLVATALCRGKQSNIEQMKAILEEEDGKEFVFDDKKCGWRGITADMNAIRFARTLFRSFGSCSLDEPREDLSAAGLLPIIEARPIAFVHTSATHGFDNTTDAELRSFVPVPTDSHFPIQNLPFGVFRRRGNRSAGVGVAIGEHVLDLTVLKIHGVLDSPLLRRKALFAQDNLNEFMDLGPTVWQEARSIISWLLRADVPTLRDYSWLRERALVPMSEVEMLLPAQIGDYTDFYSSREHASNVGTMLRGPENALMPNWLHLPVAYHGRASSIVVSGTDVVRPRGQSKPADAPAPIFGPSKSLDFELEMGMLIGPGNALGQPIPIQAAAEHIFGLVLVNDWSARDIQAWEYVPLGPFLAKNFATSISPWVVTLDALEPFRTVGPVQDPLPLPYLQSKGDWAYDIHLEVHLQTEKMEKPQRISVSNFKYLYWNMLQQLAHHTVNGCNLKPGDLLASGTISGPTPDSYGSMLELAWKGSKHMVLANGEQRTFLQDGDHITMTAWCQGNGYRVGFGEVTGKILPARE